MGEPGQRCSQRSQPFVSRLIEEIAVREEVDPMTLSPPLNSAIDVDSLETLVCGGNGNGLRVTFSYLGHQVTIEGGDEIQIEVT